jgi:hypothetical protein
MVIGNNRIQFIHKVNTISEFKSYCRKPEKDLTRRFSGDRYVGNNLKKIQE